MTIASSNVVLHHFSPAGVSALALGVTGKSRRTGFWPPVGLLALQVPHPIIQGRMMLVLPVLAFIMQA